MYDQLNVKVGDKVIYHHGLGKKQIATVTKVTPTGRIRIDCSTSQFNKYGISMGDSGWTHSFLSEYDEEVAHEIISKQYIDLAFRLMREFRYDDLTVEDAKKIIEILKK